MILESNSNADCGQTDLSGFGDRSDGCWKTRGSLPRCSSGGKSRQLKITHGPSSSSVGLGCLFFLDFLRRSRSPRTQFSGLRPRGGPNKCLDGMMGLTSEPPDPFFLRMPPGGRRRRRAHGGTRTVLSSQWLEMCCKNSEDSSWKDPMHVCQLLESVGYDGGVSCGPIMRYGR